MYYWTAERSPLKQGGFCLKTRATVVLYISPYNNCCIANTAAAVAAAAATVMVLDAILGTI